MARRPKQSVSSVDASKVGVILTPEQIAANGSEHAHQCAFFQWIVLTGSKEYEDLVWFYAVPNGGDRQVHVGAAMRAEGVKPGVPDTCLPVPVGRYAGLYIELKVPGRENQKDGGLSDKQVKWCNRLAAAHYAVAVAYGWESMVAIARRYMRGLSLNSRAGPLFATPGVVRNWREEEEHGV